MKRITSLFVVIFIFSTSVLGQSKTSQIAAASESGKPFVIDNNVVHERVKLYLLQNYTENHDAIEFEIAQLPEPVEVNPVDWDIRVSSRSGIRNGFNTVEVTIFSKDKIYKKIPLTAEIRTYDDVVVAQETIPRGEILTEQALSMARIETTHLKRNYFTLPEDVINLQASRTIGKGKPIFTDMVELPDIIHKGDIVKIIVKLKNMKVTASGKALEDGKKGETIKVENQSTGKKVMAQVVDSRTVIIEL